MSTAITGIANPCDCVKSSAASARPAARLLADAEPWDLVVLDEAHHARRRGAGSQQEGGPNALLQLMQGLKDRTRGLILLTATPMQVHPIEVWDLLQLLGLPPEWTAEAFLAFFDDIEQPNPSPEALDRMAALFQSVERAYGEVTTEDAQRLVALSRLTIKKILRALRDRASIPRRQLETPERRAALVIMRGEHATTLADLTAHAPTAAAVCSGGPVGHADCWTAGSRTACWS